MQRGCTIFNLPNFTTVFPFLISTLTIFITIREIFPIFVIVWFPFVYTAVIIVVKRTYINTIRLAISIAVFSQIITVIKYSNSSITVVVVVKIADCLLYKICFKPGQNIKRPIGCLVDKSLMKQQRSFFFLIFNQKSGAYMIQIINVKLNYIASLQKIAGSNMEFASAWRGTQGLHLSVNFECSLKSI